jgi:hypothetical protein
MNKREKIPNLSKTIKNYVQESGDVSLDKIYNYVEQTVELSDDRREITYGTPNWKHSVRRILSGLVKNNIIIRNPGSIYKWKSNDL